MNNPTNPMNNKLQILSDLYLNHREDGEFKEFAEHNDLGLPLAHLCAVGLAEMRPEGFVYVSETYALLVDAMGLPEDEEYESLEEMIHLMEPTLNMTTKGTPMEIPLMDKISDESLEGVHSEEVTSEASALISSIEEGAPLETIMQALYNYSLTIVAMTTSIIVPFFLDEETMNDEISKAIQYAEHKSSELESEKKTSFTRFVSELSR